MSDFLTNLAVRISEPERLIRPRLPSVFEPSGLAANSRSEPGLTGSDGEHEPPESGPGETQEFVAPAAPLSEAPAGAPTLRIVSEPGLPESHEGREPWDSGSGGTQEPATRAAPLFEAPAGVPAPRIVSESGFTESHEEREPWDSRSGGTREFVTPAASLFEEPARAPERPTVLTPSRPSETEAGVRQAADRRAMPPAAKPDVLAEEPRPPRSPAAPTAIRQQAKTASTSKAAAIPTPPFAPFESRLPPAAPMTANASPVPRSRQTAANPPALEARDVRATRPDSALSASPTAVPIAQQPPNPSPPARQQQQQPPSFVQTRVAPRVRAEPPQRASETPPEPTIHVTIGRVEVRAVSAPPPGPKERERSPVMSLDEYLRTRGKRGGA